MIRTCGRCGGSGQIPAVMNYRDCPDCEGTGLVDDARTMTDLTAGQMVMPYPYRAKPDLIILNDRIMAARDRGRPAESTPRQRGVPPGHGTQARAIWDRRRGNKPCAACLQAESLAHKMQVERRGTGR